MPFCQIAFLLLGRARLSRKNKNASHAGAKKFGLIWSGTILFVQ